MQKVENFLDRNSFKTGKTWDKIELLESQSQGDDLFAKRGEVVFEGVPHFLNQTVSTQSFKDSRNLCRVFIGEKALQGVVSKALDIELTPDNSDKQLVVILIEEIESFVAALFRFNAFGNLVQFLFTVAGIGKGGDKFKITVIGCLKQLSERKEAVNILFHDSHLFYPGDISLVHLPIGLELRNVIHGSLDTQHLAEFVIHLDGNCTHVVTYSGSLDTGIKVIAYFALIIPVE